jgi:hypothetical protein
MNSDTPENYVQDNKNFQNTDTGKKGQQQTSTPKDHPFTDNAEPDYGSDLSTEEISRESGHHDKQDSKIPNSDPQSSDPNGNPYDSENLDNESDSDSKDITEQDIEEDLRDNDPSEGFETEIDTWESDEAESDTFKTIEPDQDNPINKEFEIGELGNEELKEDELTRDETGDRAYHNKPSQRKF